MTVTAGSTAVPVTLGRAAERTLTFREARQSPCLSCETSPCCRFLPLDQMKVTTILELDRAAYLLNFPHIALGVGADGVWSVYYRTACRFLRVEDGLCTVHATPDQPLICAHYNPYQCWYKRVLTVDSHDDFLLVDRGRMEWIIDRMGFDDEREVVAVPDWDEMVAAFAGMPLAEEPAPAPANGWRPVELSAGPLRYADAAISDPCTGCGAWCCTTLVFPTGAPTTAAQLDFLRFALGFPGMELGISDNAWSLVVSTTCRHLDAGRCAVYGRDERPLLCKHYDALRCTYRSQFGTSRPEGFLRVTFEDFPPVTDTFSFGGDGRAEAIPDVDALRIAVDGVRPA